MITNFSFSFASDLSLCDVNGDGLDEIVVQQTVTASGGAGGYCSRIFEVSGGELREIVRYDSAIGIDSGFPCIPQYGFEVEILNKYTGDFQILDVAGRYDEVIFDDSGVVINPTDGE